MRRLPNFVVFSTHPPPCCVAVLSGEGSWSFCRTLLALGGIVLWERNQPDPEQIAAWDKIVASTIEADNQLGQEFIAVRDAFSPELVRGMEAVWTESSAMVA